MDVTRIIDLPSKTYIEEGDYIAIDNQQDGTQKVQFTNLLDSSLSVQNKAADASATGQAINELNTNDNSLQSQINTEALTRQSTDNNLQAQINQLVAPSGTAPNPAEIENARIAASVMGGQTYDTLGNAIRGQVTNLKSDIDEILIKGINLFNPEDATQSAWIDNTTGEVISDTDNYWVSDFLPNDHEYIGTLGVIRVWYYNDDKSYRTTSSANMNGEVFNAMSAGYVRVGFQTAKLDTVTVVKSESIPSATPYISPHINPDLISDVNSVLFSSTDNFQADYQLGEMQGTGALTPYANGIRFTDYIMMGKGTTITAGNSLIFNVGLFNYDESTDTYTLTKYFKSTTGETFTLPYDSLVMVSIWKSDNTDFDDTSDSQYIDIDLKTNLGLRVQALENKETVKPVYDKTDVAYFAPMVCNYYTGLQNNYDNSVFNKNTLYSTLIAEFDALVTAYPNYITKADLGVSSDEVNHLYSYTLKPISTQNSGKQLPTMLIVSGQHGFEKASIYGLYYLAKDLCEHWNESRLLDGLRNHCVIKMIPSANPYGFNNNSYFNANGVNLNKNYDTAKFPIDETGGTTPFSEPETQIIRDFVEDNLDAILLVDFHTNGSDKPTEWRNVNWIDFPKFEDEFRLEYLNRARAHLENITAHFIDEYNLNINQLCGRVTNPEWGYPQGYPSLDTWANMVGIVGHTFEGSGGFPSDSASYTPSALKYNSELIGNWLGYVYALFT